MWTYSQLNGELARNGGVVLGVGYSGHDAGKNNPLLENVREHGPIPRGLYTIGSPHDSPEHGPFAMALTPDSANEMFGRSGFLMHGDSVNHPGSASAGCIIMPRAVRICVANSGDTRLTVTA